MDKQTAAKLVRRLLAGYPHLSAHDPEGYVVALTEVMCGYPAWAGQQAIMRVDEITDTKFPPTDRQLRVWLDDAVRPYRFVSQWNARTVKQIAERPKDEPLSPSYLGTRGDGGPGTIYSNLEDAVTKHGRPIGVFENARETTYRG